MATKWTPRLTVRALRPVLAGLEALGHNVPPLLERAGLSATLLADPEQRLPPGSLQKLWDQGVAASGDECLGLHVAMAAPVASFDLHAYAMLSSPTLRDAFIRAARYQRLINEATVLRLDEGTAGAILQHELPDGSSVPRQPAEFLVACWLRFGRLVAGVPWSPERVFFAHDSPGDCREQTAILDAPLQFSSGRTAMQVPVEVLSLANPQADATLLTLLDRYTDTLLERQPALVTVSARVRAWLVEAHGSGSPAARQAAASLAMSERTLHRRLEQEGTTFRQVLDRFRHEKSVALLAAGSSITDVAFLLGYSELSAFYRAFRRWTGKSPAAVRDRNG